ncbi:predicted protein [Naegleria gruberi]|uniref:Predicted protein n=1 Tax=Naegleria gruberi TaxID=5762 RepID=D2VXF7_NAEGR|nr:uncharacterized protein NAEGRDRAFT_53017 [Naegleria gruberi]EFC38501.1 predicted protein [Naegleria gruberi]|eukprot:XP_002671245.1 predicted protein [Naegleria gruberi strain NEG-M]
MATSFTLKLSFFLLCCCCIIVGIKSQADINLQSNIPIVENLETPTRIIGSENVKLSGKIMRNLITNSIMDHFQNVMFSPISLGYSLSVILEACEKDDPKRGELTTLLSKFNLGELKNSMQSIVEFSHETDMLNDEKARLILTPALFASEEFLAKTGFKKDNLYMKNLLIQSCNFTTDEAANESRKMMNRIISEKNNETTTAFIGTGFITNATQAIYADTGLFVGKWEKPFDLNDTSIELFRVISSADEDVVEYIEIEMMNQHNSSFEHGEQKNFQWIKLKYKDAPYSMLFIVPKDALSLYGDSEERFNRFVNRQLDSGCISCSFPTKEKFFKKISIPKFRVESKSKISGLLRAKTFSAPSLFPKVEPKKKKVNSTQTNETAPVEVPPTQTETTVPEFWRLNEFFHKTVIEFSELGTVEGEITPENAKLVEEREQDDSNFVLDRPFAFILHHEPTNSAVLVGKIAVL